ncbi:MAG: hypothetical protein B7X02_01925 [Rhodospirillales bacterium 12-54-5]|nr:MAG: hypothetical protein B7X02_01925 [Rhodospirillales bacterium 12-54-5]
MAEASAPGGPDAILARLTALHPKRIDLSLDRVHRLLAALGNPERRLPPVVHVAGTNGKGSTIAYMRAMYEAAGYRVHAYTSPHLVRFNERMVLAGEIISNDTLALYLERILTVSKETHATVFEAETAVAFLAFSEHSADVLLLETGLGGRLDATNVVPQPLCSVITPIGIDHAEFLGDTLAKIASEKAGIIKPNVPCISANQPAEVAAVLSDRAHACNVPFSLGGIDWTFSLKDHAFLLRDGQSEIAFPLPHLPGGHQIANAALATMVVRHCAEQLPIDDAAIARGIDQAKWSARLQKLSYGPLVEQWAGDVYLDGGHNAHAAAAIAGWMAQQSTPVVMICAMMQRKDARAYFSELAPHLSALCCIPMPGDSGGYDAETLASAASALGVADVMQADTMHEAIQQLERYRPATVLVAVSLHLAGEVLKTHG